MAERLLHRRELLSLAAAGLLMCACGRSHGLASPRVAVADGRDDAGLDSIAEVERTAVRGERHRATHYPGELISSVLTDEPVVAFTFDDGPWPAHTQGVMNHFRAAGLEGLATFFWIGNNVLAFPEIAREVADRGYDIANHSLTHRFYSPSVLAREIDPAQDVIASVIGHRPPFFRSPGLTRGFAIQQRLFERGMCNIFTETDLGDWRTPRRSAWQLISTFERTIRPGSIVLLHDGGTHQQTVDAVPGMLQAVQRRGLEVVPLERLLRSGRRFENIVRPASIEVDAADPEFVPEPSRADARDEDFDAVPG